MHNPTLSIVLPNYNHGHFLPMAIESVLAQSFTDFELIIVDDGSSDDSLSIMQSYARQDSRIRLMKHSTNKGVADAVMTGVHAAEGMYLHGLSATDCYLPGFLEKSLGMLMQHPHIGLCCTDCGKFNEDPSEFVPFPLLKQTLQPLVFTPQNIQAVFKYHRFSTPGLSSIVKKEAFLKYGGYKKNLHFLCDWFVNHTIALFEGAAYIPETLILFREPEYTKKASQDPQIFNEAINTLIELLLLPDNNEILRRMRKAASLGLMCKKKPLRVLRYPRLWSLYFPLMQRYLNSRRN